ncbi:phenylalanine--tRNA ligase subunit alpha [SAR202 cluster bacterium AC-647-N09_OGT_505m]|nr:phenylalanine--tRNA ligase subunit alpha [SAR202 cluster bacterium AC-647-N09_OGT_505m]
MTTNTILRNLEEIQARALNELKASSSSEAVEQWRVAYMGRKGELTMVLRGLGPLAPENRRTVGAAANKVKALLEESLAAAEEAIKGTEIQALAERGRIDVTLPGRPVPLGRLHPSTQILREICAAFVSMGFQVVEGPEVEWDHYNFEMLNIPKDHPARDMWDTLWIDHVDKQGEQPMLLRTHTSPMQIRIMENARPPVRVLVPGKCYRYEATDATHESQFYQVEGLAVDEGITFADLKGTLYEFARLLFGADRKVRFRVDYFPFVEPGAEMAIDCFVCRGAGRGCRVCKGTGWIEVMGAGMVNPKVLEGVGYDSSIYTGFAFGMGPERIAMLKYGIEDVRLFYSNDLRFLRQF